MYEINAVLNGMSGEEYTDIIKIEQKKYGNVTAVYIKGFIKGFTENMMSESGALMKISLRNIRAWMADYKYCTFWCRPEFGTQTSEIPDGTEGFVYQKNDGKWGVIVPVVSQQYKCVLYGEEEDCISARLFSLKDDLNRIEALAFLYGEGENPYTLLEECVQKAVELLNNGCRMRCDRRYPQIMEYLGWCSWDAFEIRVTEQKLIDKCEEFKAKNIPVKWAIIDDMWGEVRDFYGIEYSEREQMFDLMHASKLYSFKADPYRFPNGLKECISKIKEYGITVGVWHPVTGYWRGIDPDGDIYARYKNYLIKSSDGIYVHSYEQDKAYLFYNAYHDYLKQCGAEFVKIDNQSRMSECYRGLTTIGEAARSYHKAMEASVGEHFDNCMINCMGMSSEDMWNRSVSPITRCSDDFKPENREWFAKHITQCSFNSLIQGQLYYCDWDMWWTDDAQAIKNSVLRAISGGPVYISDMLGRSQKKIIEPLILGDGKVLRCDRPGVPTRDCLIDDPVTSGRVFKVQNICGESGVIAAFNLDAGNKSVKGKISPMDVEGINGERFAVYEHFSKECRVLNKDECFELRLDTADDFRLYVVVPIKDGFAPIGLIDKYISPKTIRRVTQNNIELIENGEYAYVKDGQLMIVTK